MVLSPDESTLYVANIGCPFKDECDSLVGGSLSVVDLRTRAVTRTIRLNAPAWDIALSPNGKRLYWTSGSELTVLSTKGFKRIAAIKHPSLRLLAVSRDFKRLYAINPGSSDLAVIDPSPLRIVSTIAVGTVPQGIDVDRAGRRVYVTASEARVVATDPWRGTVLAAFDGGWAPTGIAVHPDGSLVAVTNLYSGDLLILRADTGDLVHRIPAIPFGQGATTVTFVRRRHE